MAVPRRRGDNLNDRSNKVDANFKKATASGRQLASVVGGISGGLQSAVGAAGQLSEELAKASRNSSIAKNATQIGALVSLVVGLGLAWKTATDQMKEFNSVMNKIGTETKLAELAGRGPAADLEARREAIRAAGDEEVDALRKSIKNKEQLAEAEKAIYKKTREQLAAMDRQFARERDRTFRTASTEFSDASRLNQAELDAMRATARGDNAGALRISRSRQAEVTRDRALADLARNDEQLLPAQLERRREQILSAYGQEMQLLQAELANMNAGIGLAFGASLVSAIGDGIAAAVQSGNLGDGFRMLTGSVLIGFGDMLQTIGAKAIIASNLMQGIVTAIASMNPVAGIASGIALVALGGVLKGLGGSLGGRRGGGGSGAVAGSGGGFYGGGSTTNIIDRGLVNPMNGVVSAAGVIMPRTPVNLTAVFYGNPDDARAQRWLLDTLDRAGARRA